MSTYIGYDDEEYEEYIEDHFNRLMYVMRKLRLTTKDPINNKPFLSTMELHYWLIGHKK